jgi:hypothetical protein
MLFIEALKKIWNYKQFIVGAAMVLFMGLFLQQCNETRAVKNQLAISQHIAEQNTAALNDNTIQLRVTKEQLGHVDSNLKTALVKVDSIGKIKTKVITVAQPIYYSKDVLVESSLTYDTAKGLYGLNFNSTDQVRTIDGVSSFKILKTDNSMTIVPDSTKIKDFKLNFCMVISQYDDPKTKYTRTKIIPFNVKSDGSLGNEIPDSILKVNFRNAEILDKPFTPNDSKDPGVKDKSFATGWGFSLNPLSVGMYPSTGGVKIGWTPNISFGYYLTFRKKKIFISK